VAGLIEDSTIALRQRRADIERSLIGSMFDEDNSAESMDPQELADREAAAQAYGRENEKHFVDYLTDCVQTSVNAMRNIRLEQRECWDVFNEEEPTSYARKEKWQARVTVPKPYSSCLFAQAIVQKAFDSEFLSIENKLNDVDAQFWEDLMKLQLSRSHADFPINITDASGMCFAIGQSMEMIPYWQPGSGLQFHLIPPWNIHRDPSSISRRPQSGSFWVHQEYQPYHALKQGMDDGIYMNLPVLGPGSKWGDPQANPDLTPEEIARRKDMIYQRSQYQTDVLTSEFWGLVLDSHGEVLLPKATFTVAADRVIRLPKASTFPTLRWPGTSFSILPHLLRYDGRSLLKGIKSLWYFMNNLMSLHADNLNWDVNPATEVDISSLVDQTDVDDWPGKRWLTHGSPNGQQVVRTVERRSKTGDILANMNFSDQRFQEGVMINKESMGLPGSRAEVTAREAAQNLNQNQTVVGLMGKNLENGALNIIGAASETVAINMTYTELVQLMGQEVADRYRDDTAPTGLRLPPLNSGAFKVAGISALMRDQEVLSTVANLILPMFDQNKYGKIFAPYLKAYPAVRSIFKRAGLQDEGIEVNEATAQRIDQAQQAEQEAAIQIQQRQQEADAALVVEKIQSEAGKGVMHRARADEHLGKANLAHSQAATAGMPTGAPAEATPAPATSTNFRESVAIERLYPLLKRSEQEQVLREMGIEPEMGSPALPLQPPGAGVGNPEATPPPAPPSQPASASGGE
jgi:hypothetical protein